MPRILVINPNCTQAVTDGISAAVEPLRLTGGPAIDCETLRCGPPGIETLEHVKQVTQPLCDLMAQEETNTDAFVIACYSDPGLEEAREVIQTPVFGMAQCGMLSAVARGGSFGVISLFPESVERHVHYVEKLGLSDKMAADLPVNLGVVELEDAERTYDRLTQVGRELVEQHKAEVVLLGCAGMAKYRRQLENDLDVSVIDPTHAAVTMAIGSICAH